MTRAYTDAPVDPAVVERALDAYSRRAVLKTPDAVKRWQDRGFDVIASTPEEMTERIKAEMHQSVIEVGTGVSSSLPGGVFEAARFLFELMAARGYDGVGVQEVAGRALELAGVDALEVGDPPGARRGPAVGRSSQGAQVDIIDAGFGERVKYRSDVEVLQPLVGGDDGARLVHVGLAEQCRRFDLAARAKPAG